MNELPIFILSLSFYQNKLGLVFPYELDSNSQSFTFCVPVRVPFVNNRPRLEYWEDNFLNTSYKFPFEFNKNETELKAEISNNEVRYLQNDQNVSFGYELTFFHKEIKSTRFIADIYYYKRLYRKTGIQTKYLREYIGNSKDPLLKELIFIPLIPIDLPIMNEIFLKQKGIFLGYNGYGFNSMDNLNNY